MYIFIKKNILPLISGLPRVQNKVLSVVVLSKSKNYKEVSLNENTIL